MNASTATIAQNAIYLIEKGAALPSKDDAAARYAEALELAKTIPGLDVTPIRNALSTSASFHYMPVGNAKANGVKFAIDALKKVA